LSSSILSPRAQYRDRERRGSRWGHSGRPRWGCCWWPGWRYLSTERNTTREHLNPHELNPCELSWCVHPRMVAHLEVSKRPLVEIAPASSTTAPWPIVAHYPSTLNPPPSKITVTKERTLFSSTLSLILRLLTPAHPARRRRSPLICLLDLNQEETCAPSVADGFKQPGSNIVGPSGCIFGEEPKPQVRDGETRRDSSRTCRENRSFFSGFPL